MFGIFGWPGNVWLDRVYGRCKQVSVYQPLIAFAMAFRRDMGTFRRHLPVAHHHGEPTTFSSSHCLAIAFLCLTLYLRIQLGWA